MEKLKAFVESTAFQTVILVLIILNSITIGMETFSFSDNFSAFLTIFDKFCLAIFCVELVIKLIVYRLNFFKSGWNIFDFLIISVSLIPAALFVSSIRIVRILRSLRILRAAKLFSSVRSMRIIVGAIANSLPGVIWTAVIMGVVCYIYGILGTNLYSSAAPEYFGSLWTTMYTLFQLTLADDFGEISRQIVAQDPWAAFYFISFAIITIMLLLNILVGVVVDSIEELRAQNKESARKKNSKNSTDPDDEKQQLEAEIRELKAHIAAIENLLNK